MLELARSKLIEIHGVVSIKTKNCTRNKNNLVWSSIAYEMCTGTRSLWQVVNKLYSLQIQEGSLCLVSIPPYSNPCVFPLRLLKEHYNNNDTWKWWDVLQTERWAHRIVKIVQLLKLRIRVISHKCHLEFVQQDYTRRGKALQHPWWKGLDPSFGRSRPAHTLQPPTRRRSCLLSPHAFDTAVRPNMEKEKKKHQHQYQNSNFVNSRFRKVST